MHALYALLEHDLAVEHAVHGALRGDHPQPLAPAPRGDRPGRRITSSNFVGQPRSAGLYSTSTSTWPMSQPLRCCVHLHRDRRARGEADREQLLRDPVPRRSPPLSSGSSTVSWWSRTCTVCLNVLSSRRAVAFMLVSPPIMPVSPRIADPEFRRILPYMILDDRTARARLQGSRSQGVEQQPGEQLRVEEGRLRRHVLASRRDVATWATGVGRIRNAASYSPERTIASASAVSRA